jgi:hypothetical protein
MRGEGSIYCPEGSKSVGARTIGSWWLIPIVLIDPRGVNRARAGKPSQPRRDVV